MRKRLLALVAALMLTMPWAPAPEAAPSADNCQTAINAWNTVYQAWQTCHSISGADCSGVDEAHEAALRAVSSACQIIA